MSAPDPILEAAVDAIHGSDADGCGCCAAVCDDRHDDGSKCYAAYDSEASCGGKWREGGAYSCGGRTWERQEVLAFDVLAAVRPLIEAEVRERVAREIDDVGDIDRQDVHVWREAARIARGDA